MDLETQVGILVIVFAIVAFVAALKGILGEDNSVLSFVVAIANIVMAGVIALQAISMNESVLEMKKDRMNIEYMKNEVIGYIKSLEKILSDSLHGAKPTEYLELPMYFNEPLIEWGNYQEQGLKERLKRKIQKLLEEYNINLEEYNSLVRTVNNLRMEIIESLKNEQELMKSLQRISQDGAKKFKVKEAHIIKSDILLEELVTLFNTEEDLGLSAPPYGRLGLTSETEYLYGLEVWNKAKQEFYEFLKRKPQVYSDLAAREENLKKLKTLGEKLLERISKLKEELFQSEDKLERKLMEL